MDLETMPRRGARPRGRRATGLAALVLAAAALAGCASGAPAGSDTAGAPATASGGAASPAASATGAPSAPGSTAATPPTDPAAPTPEPRPASPTPAPSASAGTPPGNGIAVGEPAPVAHQALTYRTDGGRLVVWFYGGVCEKYGLKVDESNPGRVDIRVTVVQKAPEGQACITIAKRQTVSAQLQQPLLGRTVTDLATGRPVVLEVDTQVGPNPDVPPDVSGK